MYDTLTKMIALYNNPAEKDYHFLIGKLLSHFCEIPNYSIYDMAALCETSTASVSRFFRRIDGISLQEFRKDCTDIINCYTAANRIMPPGAVRNDKDVVTAYTDYITSIYSVLSKEADRDILRGMSDEIAAAEHIVLFAPDRLCMEAFQYDLSLAGKETSFYTGILQLLSRTPELTQKHMVLLCIPDKLNVQMMQVVAGRIRDQGAGLALFCSSRFFLPEQYVSDKTFRLSYTATGTEADTLQQDFLLRLLILTFRQLHIDSSVHQAESLSASKVIDNRLKHSSKH